MASVWPVDPALPFRAVGFPLPLGRGIAAHEAGRDAVDRDAPGSEFVRELSGESDLPGLRGCVRLDAGEAHAQPGAARDVDDASVARRLHRRGDRLAAVERAVQVHGHDRAPVHFRNLLERPAGLSEHAARVVDEDVDATVARERLARHRVHRPAIGHVEGARHEPGALRSGEPLGLAQLVGQDVTADHLAPKLREGQRDRPADAVRGTGDDGDPSVEANLHHRLLLT
jgi:hypothetical protein